MPKYSKKKRWNKIYLYAIKRTKMHIYIYIIKKKRWNKTCIYAIKRTKMHMYNKKEKMK